MSVLDMFVMRKILPTPSISTSVPTSVPTTVVVVIFAGWIPL